MKKQQRTVRNVVAAFLLLCLLTGAVFLEWQCVKVIDVATGIFNMQIAEARGEMVVEIKESQPSVSQDMVTQAFVRSPMVLQLIEMLLASGLAIGIPLALVYLLFEEAVWKKIEERNQNRFY